MESHWSRELRCLLFLPALLKASCMSWVTRLASTDHGTNFTRASEVRSPALKSQQHLENLYTLLFLNHYFGA